MTYWPVFVFLLIATVFGAGVAVKEDPKAFFSCMKVSFVISGIGFAFTDAEGGAWFLLTCIGGIILGGIFYIFSLGIRS